MSQPVVFVHTSETVGCIWAARHAFSSGSWAGGAGPTWSCPWSLGWRRPSFWSLPPRFLSLDPCVHSGIWASLWLLLTLAWAVTGRGSVL